MYYVELLRVAKTLRILGYILAAVVVLCAVSRPFNHGSNFQAGPPAAAGSTPVVTKNADGSTSESYLDRKGRQVSVRIGNDGTYTATTTDPSKPVDGKPRVTSISGDENISINVLLIIAACVAALIASILGLTLSRENDGHLELAWTKPASRERYALVAMAVDAGAVLVAGGMMLIAIMAAFAIEGGLAYIHTVASTPVTLLFSIVFPLSLYAMIVAATASLRRGAAILAIFWPVALILPTLSSVTWMNLGAIVRVIDGINPIAYLYAFNSDPPSSAFLPIPPVEAYEITALVVIAALCVAASVAQWRRLEA